MFEIIRKLREVDSFIHKGNDLSAETRIADRLNALADSLHTGTTYRVRAVDQRLAIGCIVRIIATRKPEDSPGYVGHVGVLVSLDARNQDGDFYGLAFAEKPNREVYFWADELEVVTPPRMPVHVCTEDVA